MTLLTEPGRTADIADPMRIAGMLLDVSIPDDVADKAWATIQRMCPDDADLIGEIVGVTS